MELQYYYLHRYQVELLLYKLGELQDSMPYFDDPIAEKFADIITKQADEIAMMPRLFVKFNFMGCADYEVPCSMTEYLCNLTETNIFDDYTMYNFINNIDKYEEDNNKKLKMEDKKKHL